MLPVENDKYSKYLGLCVHSPNWGWVQIITIETTKYPILYVHIFLFNTKDIIQVSCFEDQLQTANFAKKTDLFEELYEL